MTVGDHQYDERFGQPVVKDGCGIFAILRKKGSPKISNLAAVSGISCIKYRGSSLGAGYASFDSSHDGENYRVRAFVKDAATARNLEAFLQHRIAGIRESKLARTNSADHGKRFLVWDARVDATVSQSRLEKAVDEANLSLLKDRSVRGRIISYGRCVSVYKEVGYPLEVAELCGLDRDTERADLWIAHTRQPTNSPGAFPIWSHPFSSGECAIVHNGDISSFGANIEQLNSWGLKSHVGTDSEVIARLLDHLVKVEGLSIVQAATVLTNPFERNASPEVLHLLAKYRGARLDGPFAVVAGYSLHGDTYLIALTDRSKFRPILIGEDEDCFYVASEENQIRLLSKKARLWTPDPGSFFIASVNRGMISSATTRNASTQERILETQLVGRDAGHWSPDSEIDAAGRGFEEVNSFLKESFDNKLGHVAIRNANGHRYIGIGFSVGERTSPRGERRHFKVTLDGFPGNCLANLNDGATFEVFGNVADDLADTMHDGEVIVHGSARDVACQALQGGRVLVRGCVGNRAGIQMREYGNNRPSLIVGETADDYLGEYMAGGIIAVLNLSDSDRPVGNYVGTGIVGGTIYIRGKVKESQVALLPPREDVLNYLRASLADGLITQKVFDKVVSLEYPGEQAMTDLLPEDLSLRLRFLYFSGKYNKPMTIEYGKLFKEDLGALGAALDEFCSEFSIPSLEKQKILESEYTIIRTKKEEKVETPIPPQEVPVEE